MLALYVILALFLAYGYRTVDGTEILRACVKDVKYRYRRWKSLNNLVSTQYKNDFMIMWISVTILLKVVYYAFLQKINRTVHRTGMNKYEISYVIHGKVYKMVAKVRRGPARVLQVIDENDNDVTDLIDPYLGPNGDFHNSCITPNFFSKKILTFNLENGETKSFGEYEIISLD